MGGFSWSHRFYNEASAREPTPIERERVQRSWQEAAAPPSSRALNAEKQEPPETPTVIRLSRYKRPWVI